MNYSSIDFWERIKKISKENNISQSELCAYIQCPVQNLRNKITRGAYPNVIDSVKIAKYLNTTVEYLVTGEEPNAELCNNNVLQEKLNKIKEIINS